ncbi:MAG: M1 family metallopeptidase [Chitinophagaceae bacterium]
MRKSFSRLYRFVLIASLLVAGKCFAQQPYWQQQVDFKINVSLNDVKHTLDGFETITYKNNSSDTLSFIWMHLWPNAFKNDKTAFAEQMVEQLDNSEFYFTNNQDRGYINKLDFRVEGQVALLEDHPQYIDISKLVVPTPLLPGNSITITTPFQVKLPKNFSRGGHIDQSYQVTQWYPKPAVYDRQGWHAMPYLDQGEFYNDFGDYEIAITLPKNYVVAATGDLQEESEKQFLLARKKSPQPDEPKGKKDIFASKKKTIDNFPVSDKATKTIHYNAKSVIDFAWFADKRFIVQHDIVALPTNPNVDAFTFILPSKEKLWKNSIQFTTRSLKYYAEQLGDYPYSTVNVVCAPPNTASGGMEYPNITLINVPGEDESELDIVIAHEVGHNWLQAMIATNERDHAWMDEGMNTYYEKKYKALYYPPVAKPKKAFRGGVLPDDPGELLVYSLIESRKDQAMETTSEAMTKSNYAALAYSKGALWMEKLEQTIGKDKMKELMLAYFKEWKMRHPLPSDFKQLAEKISGQNLDELFKLLYTKGSLNNPERVKPTKLVGLMPPLDGKAKYITALPILGFNAYDKFMPGFVIHNIGMPTTPFKFALAPLYATGSKQFNFIGAASYSFYTTPANAPVQKKIHSITPGLTIARFSTDDGDGDQYQKLYKGFFKIAPSIRAEFTKNNPNSNITKWIEWKSFFITEGQFDYKQRRLPQDTFQYYAVKDGNVKRAVHQLSFGVDNKRNLYPYTAVAQLQKAGDLLRATFTTNYFFNYSATQGVNIRFFAGKIFYGETKTDKLRFGNSRYHFTMYGANGDDDYTYSNPFIERNQSTELKGKQIMIRDGGFKYRSDYSSERPGRTDNWLGALNFAFDVPNNINPLAVLPIDMPLKVFTDIGTYAEAWAENNPDPKFLYSIGLQLPVFKIVNIYWVIIQSKQFKAPNELNGVKWWQKNVTFSIDIQNLKPLYKGISLW